MHDRCEKRANAHFEGAVQFFVTARASGNENLVARPKTVFV
jgi:hypothetical protein